MSDFIQNKERISMQTQLKLSTQADVIQRYSAIYVKSNSIQQEGSP